MVETQARNKRKFSIKQALAIYASLKLMLVQDGLYGTILTGQQYEDFVTKVHSHLHTKWFIGVSAVYSACSHLIGKTLDYQRAEYFCRFISGNYDAFQKGKTVTLPDPGSCPEYAVAFRIVSYSQEAADGGRVNYVCEIVHGPWAGIRFAKLVERSKLGLLFWNAKITERNTASQMPGELVGMYLMAELVLRDKKLDFFKSFVTEYLNTINRQLRKARMTPCPRNYRHPCAMCKVGYSECFRGVHPLTIQATTGAPSDSD